MICPCAKFEDFKQPLKNIQVQFYERVKEIVDTGDYDTKDDFTVVMQPFMVHMDPLTLVILLKLYRETIDFFLCKLYFETIIGATKICMEFIVADFCCSTSGQWRNLSGTMKFSLTFEDVSPLFFIVRFCFIKVHPQPPF